MGAETATERGIRTVTFEECKMFFDQRMAEADETNPGVVALSCEDPESAYKFIHGYMQELSDGDTADDVYALISEADFSPYIKARDAVEDAARTQSDRGLFSPFVNRRSDNMDEEVIGSLLFETFELISTERGLHNRYRKLGFRLINRY